MKHNRKFPNFRDLEKLGANSLISNTSWSTESWVSWTLWFKIFWNRLNNDSVQTSWLDTRHWWQGRMMDRFSTSSPQSSFRQKAETWAGCRDSLMILVITSHMWLLMPLFFIISGSNSAHSAALWWSLQYSTIEITSTRDAGSSSTNIFGSIIEHKTLLGQAISSSSSLPFERWKTRIEAVSSSAFHGSSIPKITKGSASLSKLSLRISFANSTVLELDSKVIILSFKLAAMFWISSSKGATMTKSISISSTTSFELSPEPSPTWLKKSSGLS